LRTGRLERFKRIRRRRWHSWRRRCGRQRWRCRRSRIGRRRRRRIGRRRRRGKQRLRQHQSAPGMQQRDDRTLHDHRCGQNARVLRRFAC
jgi:hypothetical protein